MANSSTALLPDSSLQFFMGSWAQLFVSLILGVGAVVLVFAWSYFGDRRKYAAFLAGFLPFTAAMIGIVTLNHWIHFFLCWEATSLLSFYLISFYGERPEARQGALQATLITGAGGLCLLAAILILGFRYDLWTISETIRASWWTFPDANVIGWLFVIGAFTKSAQFPFHFWLPGAMSAPTPASAFLHSATMVKAGIFLLARLHEGFEYLPGPASALIIAGSITFAWGSFRSLFQNDLKAVLASTTVANLGVMTTLLGLWAQSGDSQFEIILKGWILAHALYKASLFLYSGLIEELSGTRKLSQLAELALEGKGIRFLGYTLAGASIGMPFTLAYVPKAALELEGAFKIAMSTGLLFLSVAGLLVAVFPLRRPRCRDPDRIRAKSLPYTMLLPPSILVAGSYLLPWFKSFGVPTPPWLDQISARGPSLDLSLASSIGALTLGLGIAFSWRPAWLLLGDRWVHWRGRPIFQRIYEGILRASSVLTTGLHPGSLTVYLAWLWILVTFALSAVVWSTSAFSWDWASLGESWWLPSLASVTGVGAILILFSRRPLESVITLGIVGYVLAGVFAYMGAPDLALTQLAVENMSVIVLVLVVRGMKAYPKELRGKSHWARITLSLTCGLAVGAAVSAAAPFPVKSRLREFFSENSWYEAFGRNVVNVILVDFRALDTLAEITVLGLAAFMGYHLLQIARRSQ